MTSSAATRRLLVTLRRRRRGAIGPAPALAVIVGAFGLGALIAPESVGPIARGNVTHWGGWPLETAFVGMVLVAALATFRIAEMLYRSHDAAGLRQLPLAGGAVAVDRVIVGLGETLAATTAVVALVAPAALRGGGPELTAALAFCAIAALLIPVTAFGVLALSGALAAEGRSAGAPASASASFHLAPGAAFGALAAGLLIAKLGVEEPLRHVGSAGHIAVPRSAWFGILLPLGAGLAVGIAGIRRYAKSHDTMQAFFIDADTHRTLGGYRHFEQGPQPLGPVGKKLGVRVGAFYRKDREQLARSAPFVRAGTYGVLALALLVGWAARDSVSADMIGVCCAAWLALVRAPHRRLGAMPGERRFGFADMLVDARERERARLAATGAELFTHALLLAPAGLGLGVAGAASVAAYVGASAAMSYFAARSLPNTEPVRVAAFLGAVAAVGVANVMGAPIAAPVLGAALFIAAVSAWAASITRTQGAR